MQNNEDLDLLINNAIKECNEYLEMYKLNLNNCKNNLNNLDNSISNYKDIKNSILLEIQRCEEKIMEEKRLISDLKKSVNNPNNVS